MDNKSWRIILYYYTHLHQVHLDAAIFFSSGSEHFF